MEGGGGDYEGVVAVVAGITLPHHAAWDRRGTGGDWGQAKINQMQQKKKKKKRRKKRRLLIYYMR